MDIYNAKYIGKLEIKALSPFGYEIKFGMNTLYHPDIIYAEIKDDTVFLKFLKELLRHWRSSTVFYGKLDKIIPPECNIINKACSCNDKGRNDK